MLKGSRIIELDNRLTAWAAFLFVSFVFWFEAFRFNVNYSEYFVYLYDSVDIFSALIAAAGLIGALLVFYFFVFSAFASATRFKIIYFLLFFAATIVEYSYQKALGRFSETSDIESVVATTSEQKIESLFMYFSFAAFVPCVVFLICLIVIKTREPRALKSFLSAFTVLIMFFAGLSFIGSFFIDKKFPTVSLSAFSRTSTEFLLWGSIYNGKWQINVMGSNLARRPVEKPPLPENYRPANNIVFVIDESIRGDHFSLNGYQRKTTPVLDKLQAQDILHNWGIAVSASTGSRFSFNALISGLIPDDFPEKSGYRVNTSPIFFQYAKAMNYTTYFFDGQMKEYWGGIPDDKKFIDNWMGVANFHDGGTSPKYDIDNRIAAAVNEIISRSSGNFIVIFKRGSHIPYQADFPEDKAVFQPSYTTKNTYSIPAAEQLGEVVNSYDNAIIYNVNTFFEKLIPDYANIPNNTLILYTSDHGQSLFVNGKSSHGGKTRVEANVPLFIIGKLDKEVDKNFRASHHNIFPTLLDLMNYPENLRESRNMLSLLKATAKDSRPRFFNPDLLEKVPFD